MKYCKFNNNKLIPLDKFEEIKNSVCSLFSHQEKDLIEVYRNSLNILYQKAKNPSLIINEHTHPIETMCLKEKNLLKEDNSLEYNVESFVNYLIAPIGSNVLELIDQPVRIVEIPLIGVENVSYDLG